MPADIVEVSIKGLMPTANGCAVFLGNDEKTFVIYVDPSVGSAISMTINGVKKERPLTHDLIGHLLMGFEIGLERIIINDVNDGTYFARIILPEIQSKDDVYADVAIRVLPIGVGGLVLAAAVAEKGQ